MAVIVQEQIEPEAAGVVFTLDPVTGSRSRIVIEACAGLGERLVSGRVTPERILLRKKKLALIRQTAADGEPVLDVVSTQRLARRARWIERKLAGPQDIEWAMRGGDIWFLQARPITAVPEPKPWEDRQVWTNVNLGEVVPDVMTPMARSMIEPMFVPLFGSVLRLVGADLTKAPIVGFIAHRPSGGEAFKAALRAQGDALSAMDVKAMATERLASFIGGILAGSLANTDLLFLGQVTGSWAGRGRGGIPSSG